jgi:hypothetical protein
MVVMILSFPQYQIPKENLRKYFNDIIDHKSTKNFLEKEHAQALQHSKT